MLIKNRRDLLVAIDNLELYSDDKDIILLMLEILDDRLFVKIIEEIINGHLKFSDFKTRFSDMKYLDSLRNNIELQYKLDDDLSKLIEYRSNVLNDVTFSTYNNMGISEYGNALNSDERLELTSLITQAKTELGLDEEDELSITDLDKNMKDINKDYFNRLKYLMRRKLMAKLVEDDKLNTIKDVMYSLTNKNDTELVKLCKLKLTTAIGNGILLKEKPDDYEIYITEDGETKMKRKSDGELGDFIYPEEFLTSINNHILPLDYKYQTISESDVTFMRLNNVDEIQMKKIKSVWSFIKRGDINNKKYKEAT